MRHHNSVRKFGRKSNVRRALLRSLALELIQHGRITTTEAKAKEIRPYVEKIVTKAKTNTVASKRLLLSRLFNNADQVNKLFTEIGPKYKNQLGGYTRIMKLPPRKGDAAKMAIIEFV